MREVYTVSPKQLDDWKQICRAYAHTVGAKILFINESSFGIEHKDGAFQHIYIDDLVDILKKGV